MTFARLLPVVRDEGIADTVLTRMVDEMMKSEAPFEVGADVDGRRCPSRKMRAPKVEAPGSDTRKKFVGTDVLGFRLPFDGGVSRAADVDLVTRLGQQGRYAGTNELRFRGPPDPMGGNRTRVVLLMKTGVSGTSVLGFRVPPDGGLWKPGPKAPERKRVDAGVEERSFCHLPEGQSRRWDRLIAVSECWK